RISIGNRTRQTAVEIANRMDYKVVDINNMTSIVSNHDVVICAATVDTPLVNFEHISEKTSHKLFIDLSVPRAINPDIDKNSGIALYNIDQLTEKSSKALTRRKAAVPHVKEIINETLADFSKWKGELEVSPTINKLKKALDQIRKEELSRHSKISDEERELLEVVTKNMIQKVIKLPVLELKAACKRGEADSLVGVLNDLFNLEATKVEN
ncbi:MAG: glutamyl-tRNA reductase, partial [Bacteroidota bacterium]